MSGEDQAVWARMCRIIRAAVYNAGDLRESVVALRNFYSQADPDRAKWLADLLGRTSPPSRLTDDNTPTVQTVEKLMSEPYGEILEDPTLKDGIADAATEIRDCHNAITAHLAARAAVHDSMSAVSGGKLPRDIDGFPDRLLGAYSYRYRPWANGEGRKQVFTGNTAARITVLRLMTDVLIDGNHFWQLAHMYGHPEQQIRDRFFGELARYADRPYRNEKGKTLKVG